MEDPKIPVFSVLKKGTTLKNIFLNSPPSETGKAISPSRDNSPILIGRHPDCHIFVDHPSISRFHLEVRPKSSLQKLFVTDRSSVHGTWVSGKKIEPNISVELIDGDTIRLGASTRIYQLQWMPLSRAFEMEKQMSPLMEEASDEVLQDENFNEEWVSNVVPSAPPMMVNEIQSEREEPNPLRSDKMVKSSSLLLRRNKSISCLQIENIRKENGCEIRKGEEDLEIKEQIPFVLLGEGNEKEGEEESFVSDKENMTPVNSIGSKVLIKSNRKIERTPQSSFSLFHKEDLEIEEQKVGGFIEGNGEEIPSVFFAEGDVKEEEEMCVSDEEKITLVKSVGSTVPKSNGEINRSLLSSLSTFNLEEEPSNSDKPTSEATEQFKSNKLRSRSCLMKENGDSKLSDAKNLESLFSPRVKLQRSLFKLERSPLGENKALNVEEDRFLSDKENWTPKVPKSLLRSGKAFARDLLMAESEVVDATFASDKENLTPQSSMAIKSKNALSQNHGKNEGETMRRRKERIPFLPLFVSSPLRNSSPAGYGEEGLDETFFKNFVNNVHNLDEKAPDREHKEELPHIQGREKKKWYIVVDVGCFLTEESWKSLQLLEGIRGTQLIIPRIVIRELDHLKRCQGILSRGTKASSILQWIEDSMMKTSWWIHVQSSSETFPVAPTPPATPRSQLFDGSSGFGTATSSNFASFSTCGSLMEIVSPTAEDHILDCALLFKRIKDDGQLMLLTNSTTLRIKAMAEGLLCETPKEFRESLVNPFSKRFLWADSSSPRGIPENCHQQFVSARMPKAEGTVKGLKLILLHSSQYGMTNSIS